MICFRNRNFDNNELFFPSFFKIKETKRIFILMMFACRSPCCFVNEVALVTESCGGRKAQHGNAVSWQHGCLAIWDEINTRNGKGRGYSGEQCTVVFA
jgi:hypothetical protein